MEQGMMDGLAMLPEDEAFDQDWAPENITTTFLKCTRWLVEETTGGSSCPYHYFCDSKYPGDYPPAVDLLVILFMAASFLLITAFTILAFTKSRAADSIGNSKRRYLLPSGPVVLPLVLLILAKGQRINSIFPLSRMGPALLQLVHISALAFSNQADRHWKYSVLETSTISGILHASLYLDSVILPYYTGLDVLTSSTFSGECSSCVCRKDALIVGGKLILYRGWSRTTMSMVSALSSRMVSRIFGKDKLSLFIKLILEAICWASIASDSIYLMIGTPQRSLLNTVVYGAVCILVFLNVLRKAHTLLGRFRKSHQIQKDSNICCKDVESV